MCSRCLALVRFGEISWEGLRPRIAKPKVCPECKARFRPRKAVCELRGRAARACACGAFASSAGGVPAAS
eukprot:13789406-Alexandrium_andersonii.AAC.1